MKWAKAIAVSFAFAGPVCADSLADMRQDLAALLVETKSLQRELSANGTAGFVHDGSLLDRTLEIEVQLQRLTAQSEELSFRIAAIVKDATRRIRDLEERLCALEPACELGDLGETLPLGPALQAAELFENAEIGPILTMTEQDEFDSAKSAFNEGDTETAIVLFAEFIDDFPVGPLTQLAQLHLGQSYLEAEDFKRAARAFLESYSINETTADAPTALFQLGIAFHRMGKEREGCLTLDEVQFRFSGEAAAEDAKEASATLGCT